MMLRFTLTATCPCGTQMRGIKVAQVERVNLGNIRVKHSIESLRPCTGCGNPDWPEMVDMTLNPDDVAAVEAARAKLRGRRKASA